MTISAILWALALFVMISGLIILISYGMWLIVFILLACALLLIAFTLGTK